MPAASHTGENLGIAGVYADQGSAFSKQGKYLGTVSLASLLQMRTPPQINKDEVVVVIGMENSRIKAQAWQGNNVLATMRRQVGASGIKPRDSYQVENGFVKIPLIVSTEGGPLLLAFEQSEEELYLRKTADGSLIVYDRNFGFGELFLVPFYQSFSKWYQFKATATMPTGSSDEFQPEAGKANIYLIRKKTFASACLDIQTILDGRRAGSLDGGQYQLFSVTPGEHVLITWPSFFNVAQVKIHAVAGETYFYDASLNAGPSLILKPVSTAEGENDVQASQRAETVNY